VVVLLAGRLDDKYQKPWELLMGLLLAIGDSICSGNPGYIGPDDSGQGGPSGNTASQFWPTVVSLRGIGETYYNSGIGGNTSAQVLARLAAALTAHTPACTVIHVGINDIYNSVAQATFIANMTSIGNAIKAAGSDLIIDEIIPYGGTGSTSTIQYNIIAFNQALANLCNTNGWKMSVGLYNYFLQSGTCRTPDATKYSGDLHHPNITGYQGGAQCIAAAVVPAPYVLTPGIEGTLASNYTCVAGTYTVTNNLQITTGNLTFDCAAGSIVIKTTGGCGLYTYGAGTIRVINSTPKRKVIFTSSNDDLHGSIIPGSTGSPSAADQTIPYIWMAGATTTSIDLEYIEAWYCNATNLAVFGWNADSRGSSFTIKNCVLKYCTIGAGATVGSCFIGRFTNTPAYLKSFIIDGLSIDSTNSINNSSITYPVGAFVVNSSSIKNVNLSFSGTALFGIYHQTPDSGSVPCLVENMVAKCSVKTYGIILFYSANNSIVGTIRNCVLWNTASSGIGATFYLASGSVVNSVFTGNGGTGLDRTGPYSVTHTSNDYYNNGSNAFEALTGTEKTVDPVLGNISSQLTISSGFLIPNGYATTSSSLLTAGSGTYASLGYDPSTWTAGDKSHSASDNVGVGIVYNVTPTKKKSKSLGWSGFFGGFRFGF